MFENLNLDFPFFLGLPDHVWLAGTDAGNKSNFYWMGHDQSVTFTDWLLDQPDNFAPNQNCIVYLLINGIYLWDKDYCSSKYYFMCEERTSRLNDVDKFFLKNQFANQI